MNPLKALPHVLYIYTTLMVIGTMQYLQASESLSKQRKTSGSKSPSPTSPSKFDFVLDKYNRLVLKKEDCQADLSQKKFAINGRGIFEASKLGPELTIKAPGILPRGLASFVSLSKLALIGCSLREIPEEVCTMPHLAELDISHNPLQRLPNLKLPKLLILDASHAELTELHSSLPLLALLERLILSNNALKEVPQEVFKLSRLKHLDVSCNQLEILPEEISHAAKLRELCVGGNQLKVLPISISALSKLRTVSAEDNKFSVFPEELLRVRKIVQIKLNNNHIAQIPEGLQELLYLEELHMDQNPVTNFPLVASKNHSLKVISLQDTPIADILKAVRDLGQRGVTVIAHQSTFK